MQQSNTKDILELKPKGNATQHNTTQQCNGKICEKCPRGTSTKQRNTTEQH